MEETILKTLFKLLEFDATSREEKELADYLLGELNTLGCIAQKDQKGNIIGYLGGKGRHLLLSAHLDRVPPGRGNKPVRDGDILKGNGETNLGVDDAAGIVIILEAVRSVLQQKALHPPLVIVFTVEEEIGLQGARALETAKYNIEHGIVYDNAGAAGQVINKGASYDAFDVEIIGRAGHPGKDLSKTTSAFAIAQKIDWLLGESDNGETRVNVGKVTIGVARNVLPEKAVIQGEIRSFLDDKTLQENVNKLKHNIQTVCEQYKSTFSFNSTTLAVSYAVSETEELVQAYKEVIKKRKGAFKMDKTFIASDTNVFRGEKGLPVITISTGVEDEHTKNEWVRVSDLTTLTQDLAKLLQLLSK